MADPPALLRTVMLCGLLDHAKSPRYRPPPSLRNVPINAFVALTYTFKVALAFVLDASTRNCALPEEYSATWTATVSVDGGGGGGACGVSVSVAVLVTPPYAAEMVTEVDEVTALVVTVNVAVVEPAATVTLAGTVATVVLLLDSVTTAPPEGAALVSVTVPCEELLPTTLAGLSDSAESVGELGGGGADCTVNSRVTDHGPAVPAALMPRTRHHSLRAGSELAVSCDGVTVWLRTSGEVKVLASSI